MTRIVVGTDLSERSGAAVATAADLAEKLGGPLHLVNACAPPTVGVGPEVVAVPDHRSVVDGANQELEGLATQLRRRGIEVEVHVCPTNAADALCDVAETVEADMIVVGNKRMKGASRVLGSVPNKVAHRATCSVLIARTGD